MWDDEQIDAAIDETARQMTAGDPGGDFRARVMARIDVRPSRALTWRPIAVGVAVAAIVLVAVLVRPKTDVQQVRLKPDATHETKPEPDPTSKVLVTPNRDDQLEVRLNPDATYERRTLERPSGGYVRDVESLDLPSIDLESIAVTSLAAGDSIGIDPLPPVASIAVTPLDVDNEGD
jgi:hypothetical protein